MRPHVRKPQLTIYQEARVRWGQRARVALCAFHEDVLRALGATLVGTVAEHGQPLRMVFRMPGHLA